VYELLSLFERTGVNKAFNIHVIIVTHSPFVLSDIPKGNVLYLDEGKNVTEEKKLDTFGANVNELLCQSFFLDGGFMGELAKKRIESLVSYLNDDGDVECWNEQTAKQLIEMVGDEVIRYQLHQIYARRFKDSEYYRNWIESEARRLGIGR
jgi:predicted ATP-binding protein involved in virulence